MADAESLLKNESLPKQQRVPNFLRSAALRVVAGFQLLAAAAAALAGFAAGDAHSQLSCALSAAVCLVAFYHYSRILAIRDGAKPGNEIAVEMAVDAIRYSDWMVTLPIMVVDLHLIVGVEPLWFPASAQPLLLSLMVSLGAFVRLGLEELVGVSMIAKVIGAVAFAAASALLGVVITNLIGNVFPIVSQVHGWVTAFVLPWALYGVVAIASILWRQMVKPGVYPEALSITKDIAFGALDVWSKAVLGLYVAFKALGLESVMFSA